MRSVGSGREERGLRLRVEIVARDCWIASEDEECEEKKRGDEEDYAEAAFLL
jgi:hypothetical protein